MVQNSNFNIRYKLLILSILALIVVLVWHFEPGCLVERFIGIPCPSCGMTRAMFAFLNGDFKASLQYNPMLLSLPVLIIMFLFEDKLFHGKFRTISIITLVIIVLGFLVNYIFKLILFFGG